MTSQPDMSMTCLHGTDGESQSQLNNYESIVSSDLESSFHLQEIRQRKFDQQRREAEISRQRLEAEQQELQRQQYEAENHILETQRREAEQRELERLEAKGLEAARIEAARMEAARIEAARQEAARQEAARLEAARLEAARLEAARIEAERIEAERIEAERIEAERIEAERIEAERIEGQRMEAELNTQRKLQSSSFMHHHHHHHPHPHSHSHHHTSSLSVDAEEHLLGQSLTVNTKEAISVVQNLWHSPESTTINNARFRSPVLATPRMVDTRNKLPFDIHIDSSMTQHAMSSSKHHQGYNVQIYNDQENQQCYHTPHHSYSNQDQVVYGNHGLQNSYHYQMQVKHVKFLCIVYH